MAGSESVFNILQFGPQVGTAYSPGSAVAATVLIPVENPVNFELDRASQFPKQDRGRNVRNSAGSGFHGVRGSGTTLPLQVSFEDIMDFFEMHYSGGVTPSGPVSTYYTWLYPFEAVTPTLIPRTIEGGNTDATQVQQRLTSALIDSLTLGFPDIVAPGAFPWTLSATVLGFDRETNNLTGSIAARTGREVVQGHLTDLYEGTTGTAFASLTKLSNALKSFTITTNRNLARRAYGGSTDTPTRFGFKDMSNGTIEAKVQISATSKSDFMDIWNVASPASLGERRWRVKAVGTGTKSFTLDLRAGILAMPVDDVDGERVFRVTGEIVDDSTLGAPAAATVVNQIAGPL